MQAFTSLIDSFWAVMTIIADFLIVAIAYSIFSKPFRRTALIRFIIKRSVLIAFVVSLLATLGSLIYSEVIGYTPCKLCWLQRIFMYPQVIILGIALYKKDLSVKVYSVVLSIIGALFALYHYAGQLGWNPFDLTCLTVGYSSSCAETFILKFGYITIPMMALSAFLLIILSQIIKPADYQSQ